MMRSCLSVLLVAVLLASVCHAETKTEVNIPQAFQITYIFRRKELEGQEMKTATTSYFMDCADAQNVVYEVRQISATLSWRSADAEEKYRRVAKSIKDFRSTHGSNTKAQQFLQESETGMQSPYNHLYLANLSMKRAAIELKNAEKLTRAAENKKEELHKLVLCYHEGDFKCRESYIKFPPTTWGKASKMRSVALAASTQARKANFWIQRAVGNFSYANTKLDRIVEQLKDWAGTMKS